MKNLLLATAILMGLSSVASANIVDDGIKKQCQYLVYGNGSNDNGVNMVMVGIVMGQTYRTDTENKTQFSNNATFSQVSNRACKEAVNDNSADSFSNKYQWGVSVTIAKEYAKYRTVK